MSEARLLAEMNPYRSPGGSEMPGDDTKSPRSAKLEELGGLMVTWEKLRLLYNLIGLAPTLFIAVVAQSPIVELAACVFVANLCFCLGPLIDGYLTWFGVRQRAVTIILFVLGTMLMLLLALGYAIGAMFAPF